MNDPNRPDCNECVSDGNGRYIKCTNTFKSEVNQYTPNMVPANRIVYDVVACGGFAKKYTDSGCTQQYGSLLNCFRQYSKAGTPTLPAGVVCPPDPTAVGEETGPGAP